jgi:hypothetical protein
VTTPVSQVAGGGWRAELHGADLRRLEFRGRPVLQRLYVAVRDPAWNTIPAHLLTRDVVETSKGFRVELTVDHALGDIRFRWTGSVVADGPTLSYTLDGAAASDFAFAKIGFNLHHPLASTIGRAFEASGPEGVTRGHFADDIVAQEWADGRLTALFPAFDTLRIGDDEALLFAFSGDLFEMQDHRNWTDANLKTYVTPMSVPLPQHIQAGEAYRQSVTITVAEPAATPAPAPLRGIGIGAAAGRVPSLGTWCPDVATTPMIEAREALAHTWSPAFLRVDVDLGSPAWRSRLDEALSLRHQWGCEIELGAQIPLAGASPAAVAGLLREFAAALASTHAPAPARIVVAPHTPVYDNLGGTLDTDLLRVLGGVDGRVVGIPVIPGSEQTFADINRDWPAPGWPGIAYAISPAVHADDDRSLLENASAQGATVATVRSRFDGIPVHVGPVTLRTRTGPYPSPDPATDRPGGDRRMRSPLAAAWTLASIASLAYSGVTTVSYFDVWGRGGLVSPTDPAHPDRASLSPAVHVLADVADLSGAILRRVTGVDADGVAAVAVETDDGVRLLIANLGDESVALHIADGVEISATTFLDPADGSTAAGREIRLGPLAYGRIDLRVATGAG